VRLAGRVLGLAAALTVLAFALPASAAAAFPGRNGKIVYSKSVFRPGFGTNESEVITRGPDGRNPKTLLRCAELLAVAVDAPPSSPRCAATDPAYPPTGALPAMKCLPYLASTTRLRASWGGGSLCTMRSDGTGLRGLPRLTSADEEPAWSPRGQLVFTGLVARPYDQADIYVASADGSAPRGLTPSAKEDRHPAWSIRNRIAFSRAGRTGFDIYTMRGDGRGLRRLTFHGGSTRKEHRPSKLRACGSSPVTPVLVLEPRRLLSLCPSAVPRPGKRERSRQPTPRAGLVGNVRVAPPR